MGVTRYCLDFSFYELDKVVSHTGKIFDTVLYLTEIHEYNGKSRHKKSVFFLKKKETRC